MKPTQQILPLAVLYTITMFGSVGGGWFPVYFLKKGHEIYEARMKAMLMIAFIPLVILAAQPFGEISYWVPVLLIGIGAAAHQAWSANLFTTVSDMFPKKATASVIGIGGMLGGLGGVIISKTGGWLFDSKTQEGISKAWESGKNAGMSDYLNKLQQTSFTDKTGKVIDVVHKDLFHADSAFQHKLMKIDSVQTVQFIQSQKQTIMEAMSPAYTTMFTICALAYLIAWLIMKSLVPKMKKIEL